MKEVLYIIFLAFIRQPRQNRPTLRITFFPCLMILLALLAARPAWALDGALMTGKTLLALCSSDKNDDQFACQSYVGGVIDYHRLVRSMGAGPAIDFCLPNAVTMAQIKGLVVRYLTRYTEHRDFIAAPAVPMALRQAFPCIVAKKRKR